MQTELLNYIQDTENPKCNFDLAARYLEVGQTAAAITFFLRCADRTDDLNLAYECLLHIAYCFDKQGGRHPTVRGLYQQAITVLPKRPEAYFLLSKFDEVNNNQADCYVISSIALSSCDFNCEPLSTNVGYPGKYGLIFEKAVSSWWWGKSSETRKLFKLLIDEYYDQMDKSYQELVEYNTMRIGSGPESQAFTYYNKSDYENLRFKFKDAEKIEKNYSQVYQDMFVLSMLNGKKEGTYLEVGGGEPFFGNNSALLEKNYNWKGVSIETNEDFARRHQIERNNTILCTDALKLDYKKLLRENFEGNVIDYLQLDIEPSRNTFECLLSIPFEDYKFAVVTYEHDHYIDVSKSYREKSRKYLSLMGYELIVNDLSPDGISNFEDWWAHPDLVDPDIVKIMKDVSENTKKAKTYLLGK